MSLEIPPYRNPDLDNFMTLGERSYEEWDADIVESGLVAADLLGVPPSEVCCASSDDMKENCRFFIEALEALGQHRDLPGPWELHYWKGIGIIDYQAAPGEPGGAPTEIIWDTNRWEFSEFGVSLREG